MDTHITSRASQARHFVGSLSVFLLPIGLMLAFATHFENLGDFFVFRLSYEPHPTESFMALLRGADATRLYLAPHYIGFFTLPFMIGTGMVLGILLYKRLPVLAVTGISLVSIGTIYMGGVFGSWLSFAAVANVDPELIDGATATLAALTEMQGALMITSALSALSLGGLMLLAAGLYYTRQIPRWSAASIFAGNLLILAFMDLDNWMFIGALLMLAGLAPIGLRMISRLHAETTDGP